MNELAKLPQSLALDTVTTYLKAATVQVNDNQLGDKRLLLPWLLVTAVIPIAPGEVKVSARHRESTRVNNREVSTSIRG
jgi:hypothetical protein